MENKDKNTVWHYTKMETIEKMFPAKYLKNGKENEEYRENKINIRFTNIRFLNDPSEALILKELLTKNKDDVLKILKNKYPDKNFDIEDEISGLVDRYIFSATYLKDSMIFWNKEYAGVNGIAIELNKEGGDFTNITYADSLNDETIDVIAKIIYDYHEKDRKVKDDFFSMYPDMKKYMGYSNPLSNFIDTCSSFFKSTYWEAEKEARIILKNEGENIYKDQKIYELVKKIFEKNRPEDSELFKIIGGFLEPRIEFIENKIKKICYKYFDKDIVSHIMLGPACKSEQEEAIRFHLKINGYNDDNKIKVSRSRGFDLQYMTDKNQLHSKPPVVPNPQNIPFDDRKIIN